MKKITIVLILIQLIGCTKQRAIINTTTPKLTKHTVSETPLTGCWNSIQRSLELSFNI
jgi:hypothetical protein